MKQNIIRSLMAVTFIATLMLAGCQKDTVTLRFRINHFGADGKVYMNGNLPVWSSTESIWINEGTYTVTPSGSSFSLSVPSSPSYSAFYPTQFAPSASGNQISFTLPRVQFYVEESGNQLVKAPMAAYATEPSQTTTSVPITFNNIGALLAINIENNMLNNAMLTVDSVVVTTVGNTLPLWGDAVLPNITDENSYYRCEIPDNAVNPNKYYTVSVARGNGNSLFTNLANGAKKKVYVFIPSAEGLRANKFKITVYYNGGISKSREQTSPTGGLIRHGQMATVPFEMRQVEAPAGAVSGGKFSVNATTKVWFSAGNLQWKPTSNLGASRAAGVNDRGTWRIAPRQWDFVGYEATSGGATVKWGTVNGSYNNGIENANYSGWIDLFGWGTSGYPVPNDAGNNYYRPYDYAKTSNYNTNNYWGYGPSGYSSLTVNNANCDWGVYNTITYNGSATTSSWRTLTAAEWKNMLGINSATSPRTVNGGTGLHYCFSPVKYKYHNGDSSVYGIVIYHDDYSGGSLSSTANPCPDITEIPAGCVFLPVTSYRDEASVQPTGTPILSGYYWSVSTYSSTSTNIKYGATMRFISGGGNDGGVNMIGEDKYLGNAVRLVTPVQ